MTSIMNFSASEFKNENFKELDFSGQKLVDKEFENCTFYKCIFNGTNLSQTVFVDCQFEKCEFSLSGLVGTVLNNVKFIACKISGLDFRKLNSRILKVYFEKSLLQFCELSEIDLSKTLFSTCDIKESNFYNTNLTGANFTDSDLDQTIFENCILKKTDFSRALNCIINPANNKFKKTKFSRASALNILKYFDIEIID